jgi:hypothetical protein
MGVVSHDQQSGAPRTFALAGREFPVSGLTPYQLGLFEAHLKDVVPSPLAEFRALVRGDDTFTPDERRQLFDAARAAAEPQYDGGGFQISGWPPAFNSRVGQQVLFHGTGIGYFLFVVLSKHTPGLTRAEAEALAPHFTIDDLRRLTELIQVRPPDGDDATESDDTKSAA